MGAAEKLERFVAPACLAAGVELFDLEVRPGLVRVTIDRPGGIDLDGVAGVSKAISAALDAAGASAPSGRYELEVTTPGVERRLRRPAHFAAAVGSRVAIRTQPGSEGERRFEGELVSADDSGLVVRIEDGERHVAYDEVERAHTVFDWRAALAKKGGAAKGAPSGPTAADRTATKERVSRS